MSNTQPPGAYVGVSDAAAAGSSTGSTGTFFIAGLFQRGPVGQAVQIGSMAAFNTLLGGRVSYSSAYDAADVYFNLCPTGTIQASRVVGPAATAAHVSLNDAGQTPQPTLKVSAIGPGVDGNLLSVNVLTGPVTGTYQLQIEYNGTIVETSPALTDPTDAVNWGTLNPAIISSTSSKWVTVSNLGSTNTNPNPAVTESATALTGGADDNTSVTDQIAVNGLSVFVPSLGPGQVAIPGRATTATYEGLAAHAQANNRLACLDPTLGANASTTASAVTSAQTGIVEAGTDPSYSMMAAPWITWPGIATGTVVPSWPRIVPPSAVFAGLCALNDLTNDCNIACAGNGQSPTGNSGVVASAIGVNQSFVNADRLTLDNAGVSTFIVNNGTVMLYGYQSLATDPDWTDLANVRFRMQLVNDALNIAEDYVFSQIDGAGTVLTDFNGALTDNLATYYAAGSLYGATAANAYSVDTGPTVNTPTTIANRQLCATENVCMSPSARTVSINIVKYPIGSVIPAGSSATATATVTVSS